MRSTMIPLLSLLFAVPSAHAGPWIREAGSGWAKVGGAHFRSADGFANGRATGLPYQSWAIETYGEVGLGGGMQVIASLPWVSATQVDGAGARYHHRWTGDLRLEVARSLSANRPLALALHARIPTYRDPWGYDGARGATPNQFALALPQFPELGDPSVDLTLKLQWGTSSARGWWTMEGGPRVRTNGFRHGLFAATDGGLWLLPERVAVTTRISGNVNVLPLQPDGQSREVLTVGGGVLLGPGPGIDLSVHTVPAARYASTGASVHAAAFLEW